MSARRLHMRTQTTSVALAFLIFLTLGLSSRAESQTKPQRLSAKKLTALLNRDGRQVFYGGVMVPAGDTLTGPIVVIAGALDIQDSAVLAGDAWIVDGSLILTGSARVLGRVDLVNSQAYLSRGAEITGGVSQHTCECRLDNERFDREGKPVFKKYEDPRSLRTKSSFSFGEANRVDYNVAQVGLVRQNPRVKKPHTRGHFLLLFPFRNNNRGYLGFDLDVAVPVKGGHADLLVRGFKKTFTTDDWQLSRGENSLLLDLIGQDYPDYFEKQGGALGLRVRPAARLSSEVVASFQRDVSLITRSSPSLFHPGRRLRDNPPIDEGERLAVTSMVTFDTRDDTTRPHNAWLLSGWMEKGIADGPGDFSYTAFAVDLRRYTRLPFGLHCDTRARVFSTFDAIPPQVTQSLNGYGGIRGLNDVPFAVPRGDRLALGSVELREGLPSVPIIRWLFTSWDLVLFGDVGLLARATNAKAPFGFLGTPFDEWKKSAGIGISGESFLPYVGIYVAQDLDRQRRNPRVIVRLMRTF